MAMLWAGFADSAIGCWNAKFSFSFWRPVTAIRAGGGNPALVADPNWSPLASTPAHPEYPAAQGCVTGAVSTILEGYFGTRDVQFSVDSLVTHTAHTFATTADLLDEVENARVYAGFHYHHSVIQGKVLGTKVGHQLVHRYFAPVKGVIPSTATEVEWIAKPAQLGRLPVWAAGSSRACLFAPAFSRARFGTKGGQEFASRQGIDHVLFRQPAAASHGDAVADKVQHTRAV